MVPRRRKPKPVLLSGDGLKAAGLAAGKLVGVFGLVGSLFQGWQAGRKAQGADDRAGAVASYALTGQERLDSLGSEVRRLKASVAKLERRARPQGRVFGPEVMPPGYRPPESRGLLWKLKNLGWGSR
jgi:hypothetical protein